MSSMQVPLFRQELEGKRQKKTVIDLLPTVMRKIFTHNMFQRCNFFSFVIEKVSQEIQQK